MKSVLLYIHILLIVFSLYGCAKPGSEDLSKIHRMLSGMETYTCVAEITVRGNKLISNYVVKQYFKYPDRYRLEVLSPEDRKGKTTLYDGSRVWIHNPIINQTYVMENFKEVEETGMFPGFFARNLLSGEQAEYSTRKDDSGEFVSIKVEIPGGNTYRKYQVLYIDRIKIVPVKMEIYDADGNISVTIFYRDFKYNDKIDDRLFEKL